MQLRQAESATLLQSKWRSKSQQNAFKHLNAENGETIWTGSTVIDGENYLVSCQENFLPLKKTGVITYEARAESPSPTSIAFKPLKTIHKADKPIDASTAEHDCKSLVNRNGHLAIDYSKRPAEQVKPPILIMRSNWRVIIWYHSLI